MIKGTGKRLVPRKLVDWLKKLVAKYEDPDDVGAIYEHVITVNNYYIFRIYNSSSTPLTKLELINKYKGKYNVVFSAGASSTDVTIGLHILIDDSDVKPYSLNIDLTDEDNPMKFQVDMNTTIQDTVIKR